MKSPEKTWQTSSTRVHEFKLGTVQEINNRTATLHNAVLYVRVKKSITTTYITIFLTFSQE